MQRRVRAEWMRGPSLRFWRAYPILARTCQYGAEFRDHTEGCGLAVARQRKTYSFEKALEELERLVESMEDGALSLEQSLSSYERGMELARICQHALDEAEQRIKILTEKDGEIIEKPLETDGD